MDEYSKAARRFEAVYRPLQKKYGLRSYMHFDIYENKDGLIEVWEYQGEVKGRRVCRVSEESDIECYRRAAEVLEGYKMGKEKAEGGKKAIMAS